MSFVPINELNSPTSLNSIGGLNFSLRRVDQFMGTALYAVLT